MRSLSPTNNLFLLFVLLEIFPVRVPPNPEKGGLFNQPPNFSGTISNLWHTRMEIPPRLVRRHRHCGTVQVRFGGTTPSSEITSPHSGHPCPSSSLTSRRPPLAKSNVTTGFSPLLSPKRFDPSEDGPFKFFGSRSLGILISSPGPRASIITLPSSCCPYRLNLSFPIFCALRSPPCHPDGVPLFTKKFSFP